MLLFFLFVLVVVVSQQNSLWTMNLQGATVTSYFSGGVEYKRDYQNFDYQSYQDAYCIRIDLPYSDNNIQNIKKDLSLKKVLSETIDNLTIDYYYSYKLPKTQYKSIKKYNIMMVTTNNKIILGYPIIGGSY